MKKVSLILLLLLYFTNILYAESIGDSISTDVKETDWEVFPIISYDTDAGLGYGIKGYLRNLMGGDESYDLILYNSTKGERWYRFQFSLPDYEVRQGTDYGYALDLIIDYDKWISYYFYGIGNYSLYENSKSYTNEPFNINLILNRTITSELILQTGVKYERISYINFPIPSLPDNYAFIRTADQLSFMINALFDTRNSIINPDKGICITTGFETSPSLSFTKSSFSKAFLTYQFYHKILLPGLVFAGRISADQLIGSNIPIQFLLPVGGTQTLRGFRQDRFIDRSRTLVNAELRFPIWRRFGGIAGIDAGRVYPSLREFSFKNWKINPVLGLRYYMNNFVVRADVGISNETTGFYLNFGHIF